MTAKSRPCMVIYGDYQALGILEQTYEDTISLFQCFIPSLSHLPTSTIRLSTAIYTAPPKLSNSSDSPITEPPVDVQPSRRIIFWSHPRAWQAAMDMWDADEERKFKVGDTGLRVVWVDVVETAKKIGPAGAADAPPLEQQSLRRSGPEDGVAASPSTSSESGPGPRSDGHGSSTSSSITAPDSALGANENRSSGPSPQPAQPDSARLASAHQGPNGPSDLIDMRSTPAPIRPIQGLPSPRASPARTTPSSSPPTPTTSRPSSIGKRVSWISYIEKPFRSASYSYQAPVEDMPFVASPVKDSEDSGRPDVQLPRHRSASVHAEAIKSMDAPKAVHGFTPGLFLSKPSFEHRDHSRPDMHNAVPFPRNVSQSTLRSTNSSHVDLNDHSSHLRPFSAPTTPRRTPPHSRTSSFSQQTRPPGFRRASTDASDGELRRNSILAPKTELLEEGYLQNRCVERPGLRAVRESNGGAKYSYGGGSYTGMAPEIKVYIRPVDEWRSAQTTTIGRYQPIADALAQYAAGRASGDTSKYRFTWEGVKLASDDIRTPHDLGIRESLTIDAYLRKAD